MSSNDGDLAERSSKDEAGVSDNAQLPYLDISEWDPPAKAKSQVRTRFMSLL